MRNRVRRLQERLPALNIDALLIFDIKNIRYLTDFTGSEGVCLLQPQACVLLVDGRYLIQAREQARNASVELCRDKLSDLADLIAKGAFRTVGFESAAVTYDVYNRLKRRLRGIKLEPVADEVEALRTIKEAPELAAMNRAVDLSHQALAGVLSSVRPGVREKDIAVELEYRMKTSGAEDVAFPTIVASGPRTALPHAEPGDRAIRPGDGVIIDYGAVWGGYRSDETCTLIVGAADPEMARVYRIVKEAHDRAIEAVRPGVACRDIDRTARHVIEAAGFGDYFPHGTGHGVGLDVHEAPRLAPTSGAILERGMVITVEPGIYLPGKWGVRIEDMVLVEEGGGRVLTKTSKDLEIIN